MWDYTSFNRMSLQPLMTKPAFTLGTAIHGALEDWLISNGEADLNTLYYNRALQITQQAIDNYKSLVGAAPSPSELTGLFEALQLGKAMMHNYQDHYKTPIDYKQYHLVQTEQTISIPIEGSLGRCEVCLGHGRILLLPTERSEVTDECTNCNGTGKVQNYLEATLDAIIADKRDRLLPLDHKTYNSHPNKLSLEMNFQFIAYEWAVTKLNIGPVIGFAYDGMWKRDGTGKNQTPDTLFHRDILMYKQAELYEFEQSLISIVTEMSNDPIIVKHVPWNGCFDCGFVNLCRAQSQANGYQQMLTSRYIHRPKTRMFLDED